MSGLARLLRVYGQIEAQDQYGNKVIHVWDYANEKPRIKSEMTQEELIESEKSKWSKLKGFLDEVQKEER